MSAKEKAEEILIKVWANHGILGQEDYQWLQDNCPEKETSFDQAINIAGLQDEYEKAGRPTWQAFIEWWKNEGKYYNGKGI